MCNETTSIKTVHKPEELFSIPETQPRELNLYVLLALLQRSKALLTLMEAEGDQGSSLSMDCAIEVIGATRSIIAQAEMVVEYSMGIGRVGQ